ncbi:MULTISPECIES: hypothetical protein [Listeria]|uniref:hypothetical protein n=1 Tax=Listeria TaxID=1637 RepID=UPI0010E3F917|nr:MULTISPECIES: hypothetical protein [Listeria]EAD6317679.1 hypothetical protein [Listeria monocytogenes]EAF8952465.1 hypothetical protein [Listeria monocytogenes]EAF8959035.1 hypothetical protein [Listeria monocytogenes]EAF8961938.1 hypothetical protein [Listeria monocytogenes]EAF8983609.1 hypothetical protein [Listeria monocytogenes]
MKKIKSLLSKLNRKVNPDDYFKANEGIKVIQNNVEIEKITASYKVNNDEPIPVEFIHKHLAHSLADQLKHFHVHEKFEAEYIEYRAEIKVIKGDAE